MQSPELTIIRGFFKNNYLYNRGTAFIPIPGQWLRFQRSSEAWGHPRKLLPTWSVPARDSSLHLNCPGETWVKLLWYFHQFHMQKKVQEAQTEEYGSSSGIKTPKQPNNRAIDIILMYQAKASTNSSSNFKEIFAELVETQDIRRVAGFRTVSVSGPSSYFLLPVQTTLMERMGPMERKQTFSFLSTLHDERQNH